MFQRRNGSFQKKRQQGLRREKLKRAKRRSVRPLSPEVLEDRRMFALLGVAPLDFPIIGYDQGGTVELRCNYRRFFHQCHPAFDRHRQLVRTVLHRRLGHQYPSRQRRPGRRRRR